MNKISFKNDMYRKSRGGYSRCLEISCSRCNTKILKYQKDGPGALKRIYIDRIISPQRFLNLNSRKIKEIPILKCSKCDRLLAYPYIYKKEKRNALRVFQDAIKKKIIKLS